MPAFNYSLEPKPLSLSVSLSLSLSLTHTHTHTQSPVFWFVPYMQGPTLLDGQWKHTWLPRQVTSIHHFLSWFLRPNRPRSYPAPCPRSLTAHQSVSDRVSDKTRRSYSFYSNSAHAGKCECFCSLLQVWPCMLPQAEHFSLVLCLLKEDYQNNDITKQPSGFSEYDFFAKCFGQLKTTTSL